MSKEYLHVKIGRERFEDLEELIPWGLKRLLFSAIVDQVIAALRKPTGKMWLAAIFSGELDITEKHTREKDEVQTTE